MVWGNPAYTDRLGEKRLESSAVERNLGVLVSAAFAPVLGYYMWENPNPMVFNWKGRTLKGLAGALKRGLKRAVPGWQGAWEKFGKWIGHVAPPITWDFTPEQAFDPSEITHCLMEGCLTYRNPNTQISALCWGLASAYRATVDHAQKAKAETGTQTMPLGISSVPMESTKTRVQMPLEASTVSTKSADIEVPVMDSMNMGTQMTTPTANSMTETGTHITNSEITVAPITKKKTWIRDNAGSTSLAPRLRCVTEEEEVVVREKAHPKELGAHPKEKGMHPKEEGAAAQMPDETQKPPRRMLTPDYTLLDCSTEEMEDYLRSSSRGPED
ncbi:hypothetical protein BTVI_60945 [Pitangus sulphuratus]|nr:hypothetical protein BTVI_60945 [Pitangus sulphuratus]